MKCEKLLQALQRVHRLAPEEWTFLLVHWQDCTDAAMALARQVAVARFGTKIFFRGIIEFTSYCRNDCLYCGLRRSNQAADRYRLTQEEILACCEVGYALDFRTFVLQGGEDGYWTDDRLVALVAAIRRHFPDCAITLSIGERSRASYQRLFDAGADRYLLRHETACPAHYRRIHPPEMRWENRLRCLRDLLEIGYQTGCGMMVGTPGQTVQTLVQDMQLLQQLRPQMVGIGPFLPHRDTPLRDAPPGDPRLTCYLLALTRLLLPDALLPATTALGTAEADGRKQGVLAGCNVVMPNLTPLQYREGYQLYDKKPGLKDDPETFGLKLEERIQSKGREVGWNLSGSSRKWLNRTGNSQEGYDGKKSAGEQSVVWIKSTDS